MDEKSCISLLESHGIKPTANRIVILKALAAEPVPVSMSSLESSISTIDKSNIFRTLAVFKAHSLVHVVEDGGGTLRYELCKSGASGADEDMHVHFYCEQCRRLFCFPAIPLPAIDIPEGYEASSATYMIKGTCPQCLHRRGGTMRR